MFGGGAQAPFPEQRLVIEPRRESHGKMENFITSRFNASLNIHTQSIKRELVRSLQKFTNRLECYNSMILLYYTIIYTMSFTVFATLWHVIIWFCFTTTGNYQIREFD